MDDQMLCKSGANRFGNWHFLRADLLGGVAHKHVVQVALGIPGVAAGGGAALDPAADRALGHDEPRSGF